MCDKICNCDDHCACTACNTPMLDPTKPVQTRDGRKARIICTDRKSKDKPIVALITQKNGTEEVCLYSAGGRHHIYDHTAISKIDLVNVVPEVWVNIYGNSSNQYWCGVTYRSEEEAKHAYSHAIKAAFVKTVRVK